MTTSFPNTTSRIRRVRAKATSHVARADRNPKPDNITQPSIAAVVVNLLTLLTMFADVPSCDLVLRIVSHPSLLEHWIGTLSREFVSLFVQVELPCAMSGPCFWNDPRALAGLVEAPPATVCVATLDELLVACDRAGAGLGFGWVELRGEGLLRGPYDRGAVVDAPALRHLLDVVIGLHADRGGGDVWLYASSLAQAPGPELVVDGGAWLARLPQRFGIAPEHVHVCTTTRTAVAA